MLSLQGIRAGYGNIEALHGIDLEVKEGEIVTLIGANGAGKTSTLMTICGCVKARAGKVMFGSRDITSMRSDEIVKLGLVQSPEGRKIFPRLTVAENLEMGAFIRNDKDGIAKDMKRVYDLFPILGERRGQAGGTLSGGEQQMLAVGRAMMSRPRLLLLDEPSLGLAPLIVTRIFEVIQQLNKEGTTILLVEQNARSALKLAHRGYVMETGSITMTDDAKKLLEDERVKSAYLGDGH
jgi:branched-chain amino acid transport system ATP-binding protein